MSIVKAFVVMFFAAILALVVFVAFFAPNISAEAVGGAAFVPVVPVVATAEPTAYVYQEVVDPQFTPVAPSGETDQYGLRLHPGDEVLGQTRNGCYEVRSPLLGFNVIHCPVDTLFWPYQEGSFSVSAPDVQAWPPEFPDYYETYEFVCLYAPAGTPIYSPMRGPAAEAVQLTRNPNANWVAVFDEHTHVIMAQKSLFDVPEVGGRWSSRDMAERGYVLGYSDGGCLQVAAFDKRITPANQPYHSWLISLKVMDVFPPTAAAITGAAVRFE